MRRNLVDIVGSDAAVASLAGLSGYLEADAVQEATAGGLVVSVGLVNGGDAVAPLLNPFALVQFQARNEHGRPLTVPTPPPPLLVHTAGGEDWTLGRAMPVVGVLRNGQAADPSSLNVRVMRVAAHEECRVSFAIERFQDGLYWVGCIVTLIHGDRTDESRILHSDEIEVRIGAPAR